MADAIRITREVDGGNVAYVHTDQLGQPQKLTDASKAVVWDRVARPFGATAAETGTTAVALRFPGQWADAESGYHYNYFRDYDPSTGRYLQSDPIGLKGGLNRYGYVKANPQNLTDRTGQCLEDLCVVEGMILAAAIDVAIQLYDNDGRLTCIDWGQVGWSAGLGALPIGGVLSRFGRGLLPYLISQGTKRLARNAANEAGERVAREIAKRLGSQGAKEPFTGNAGAGSQRVQNAAKSIEDYLGPNFRIERTAKGNLQLRSADNTRVIRLDINVSAGQAPHANVQTFTPSTIPGRMQEVFNKHIFFK